MFFLLVLLLDMWFFINFEIVNFGCIGIYKNNFIIFFNELILCKVYVYRGKIFFLYDNF